MQIIDNASFYIEQNGEQVKIEGAMSVIVHLPSKKLSGLFKSVKLAGVELTSNR